MNLPLVHHFRAILLLACLACAQAETPVLTPIPSLLAEAQVVLHAKVLSSSTQRDTKGEIYTEIAFEPIATWKGKIDPARQKIVHSGGVLGEEMALASGQVEYWPGEEFVSFLVLNARGELVTVGMNLGKFRIENQTATRLTEKIPFEKLEQLAKAPPK